MSHSITLHRRKKYIKNVDGITEIPTVSGYCLVIVSCIRKSLDIVSEYFIVISGYYNRARLVFPDTAYDG